MNYETTELHLNKQIKLN